MAGPVVQIVDAQLFLLEAFHNRCEALAVWTDIEPEECGRIDGERSQSLVGFSTNQAAYIGVVADGVHQRTVLAQIPTADTSVRFSPDTRYKTDTSPKCECLQVERCGPQLSRRREIDDVLVIDDLEVRAA